MTELGPIDVKRLSGDEMFHECGHPLAFSVLDFWQWGASDLVSNITRGIVAEYLVAQALGVAGGVREEWAPYDLMAADGTRIEVKSAAYIQSWQQRRLSRIVFRIPKTRAWDSKTNRYDPKVRRQADVYVFAILAHQDQATLDPLDACQWAFFVVPAAKLENRRSITLSSLRTLAGRAVEFSALSDAIGDAAGVQRQLTNALT